MADQPTIPTKDIEARKVLVVGATGGSGHDAVVTLGSPVLLGAAAFAQFRAGDQRRGAVLTASAVTYLIGVFGVTAARNVPLNDALDALDALDAFDLEAMTADQIEHRRASYEGPWNRWNTVRAIANVAAFALATTAAVLSEQTD